MKTQAQGVALESGDSETASLVPSPDSRPSEGDVLVSERSARADVFAISLVPAEGHLVVPRYSDAIARVHALARRLRVDGWFTSDQTHYVRVASYRPRPEA
jgi:hypothetical protein